MASHKVQMTDDTIINVVAIVAIVLVVITSLLVVAHTPAAGDSVNVFAVGGVTAIASFLRRPQQPAVSSNAP